VIQNDDHLLLDEGELESAPVRRADGWKDINIRFITGELSGARTSCLFRATFEPGAAHERHHHPNADEFFYLIGGRAAVGAGDEEYEMQPGMIQFIPAGKVHWLRNVGDEPVNVVGIYVGGSSLEEAGYVYVGEVTDEYRKVD
jgi:quercetin dioxygenase-like cupin family protein